MAFDGVMRAAEPEPRTTAAALADLVSSFVASFPEEKARGAVRAVLRSGRAAHGPKTDAASGGGRGRVRAGLVARPGFPSSYSRVSSSLKPGRNGSSLSLMIKQPSRDAAQITALQKEMVMSKSLGCAIAFTVLTLPALAQGTNQNTPGAVQTSRNLVQERCMETAQRRVANRGDSVQKDRWFAYSACMHEAGLEP